MALVNHNNNVAIAASGSYCPITVANPPNPLNLTTGAPSQVIEQLGFLIVGNAAAAGTVNLQVKDPLDATYRTPGTPPSPFPITIAASGVYAGVVSMFCHGAQLVVTLTGGQLTVCELIGKVTEYDE